MACKLSPSLPPKSRKRRGIMQLLSKSSNKGSKKRTPKDLTKYSIKSTYKLDKK